MLAEGRARAPAANDGAPEVTPAPSLAAMRDQLKTVAVRVPEACAACDAWARALERSLATAGYRVLSGESVRQLEKTEGIPVHAAAGKAGADVVFAFSDVTSKVDTIPRTFEFSASDANGAKLSPMSIAEADRASLEGIITSRAGPSLGSVTALRVEGTVVVASSGEIVLRYRRSATLAGSEDPVSALFVNNHKSWSVVKPEHPAPPPPSPPQQKKDPSDVLSDWAADFAARFHG